MPVLFLFYIFFQEKFIKKQNHQVCVKQLYIKCRVICIFIMFSVDIQEVSTDEIAGNPFQYFLHSYKGYNNLFLNSYKEYTTYFQSLTIKMWLPNKMFEIHIFSFPITQGRMRKQCGTPLVLCGSCIIGRLCEKFCLVCWSILQK